MCGISGSFNFINEKVMKSMLSITSHRGPDDSNYFFDELCMLGINRLSILDLELGKQPMKSVDKNIILVFNGEIFNYLELKDSLEKKGLKFFTKNSDTETIIVAYQYYGLDFLKYLNGMFSLALYDIKKKKLILARDRVGIKPLFYTQTNNGFFFASEIKSLLTIPFVKKEPEYQALLKYFSLKNIPAPLTSFKNIKQLRPAEIFEIDTKNLKKSSYWNFKRSSKKYSESELQDLIYKKLEKSVKLQLRSDVDLACFLSGGLDSSAITAIASQLYKKKLKTFSVVYDKKIKRKDQDNLLSKKVSKLFNTEHHELFLDEKKIFNDLEKALLAFDQPFSGAITTYFLSQMVSKFVKVALTGDGADELFGSYSFPRIMEPVQLIKNKNHKLFKKFLSNSDEFRNKEKSLNELSKKTLEEIRVSLFSLNNEEKKKLFNKTFFNNEKDLMYYFETIKMGSTEGDDLINKALKIDFKTLLPDQVLSFVDILSMQHSLEIRPPFLDNDIIDLAFSIPGYLKIQNSIPKLILKKSLKRLLPNDIVNRPKEGFVMPIEEMFIKKNKDYVCYILSNKNINKHNLFDNSYLESILKNIENNSFKKNNMIWILFSFQIWWNKHFS